MAPNFNTIFRKIIFYFKYLNDRYMFDSTIIIKEIIYKFHIKSY